MPKRIRQTLTMTPLDHCPICCYSLHGLPRAHRCPECNFQYDEYTRLWERKSQPKKRMLPVWVIISVVLLVFARPVCVAVGGNRQMQFSLFLVLLMNLLPMAVIQYGEYFSRSYVVVNPEGLFIKPALRRLKVYSWDELERLSWAIIGGPPIEVQTYFPERPVYERLIGVVGRWSDTRPEICKVMADEIQRRSAVEQSS